MIAPWTITPQIVNPAFPLHQQQTFAMPPSFTTPSPMQSTQTPSHWCPPSVPAAYPPSAVRPPWGNFSQFAAPRYSTPKQHRMLYNARPAIYDRLGRMLSPPVIMYPPSKAQYPTPTITPIQQSLSTQLQTGFAPIAVQSTQPQKVGRKSAGVKVAHELLIKNAMLQFFAVGQILPLSSFCAAKGYQTVRLSIHRRFIRNSILKSFQDNQSNTIGFTLPQSTAACRAVSEALPPFARVADVEEQPLCDFAVSKPKSPIPTEGELITAIQNRQRECWNNSLSQDHRRRMLFADDEFNKCCGVLFQFHPRTHVKCDKNILIYKCHGADEVDCCPKSSIVIVKISSSQGELCRSCQHQKMNDRDSEKRRHKNWQNQTDPTSTTNWKHVNDEQMKERRRNVSSGPPTSDENDLKKSVLGNGMSWIQEKFMPFSKDLMMECRVAARWIVRSICRSAKPSIYELLNTAYARSQSTQTGRTTAGTRHPSHA